MTLKKKMFIYILIIFFNISSVHSLENKILFRVNNEIITSIDLYNERNYLVAINKDIKRLEESKILEIAKNSLIKEKIITKEILKYTDKLEIEEQFLNNIIEEIYKKQNLYTFEDFVDYLKNNNLSIEYLKKRISIEIIWNDLIVAKFSSKIKIDSDKIKAELTNEENLKSREYFLSEIVFNNPLNSNFDEKIQKIENDIKEKGFKNAVLIHSISNSSTKNSGEIGWVNENSLNFEIRSILRNLNISNHTNPITVPGGFLILRIDDIKIVENKDFNIDKKLEEIVISKRNEQLNNYSNIYYNKIRKENQIDEEF